MEVDGRSEQALSEAFASTDLSSQASFVLTLVHGTYARGAPWTQHDSLFCNHLRKELGADGNAKVEFFSFCWNGANTHQDRRSASIGLRKQLLHRIASNPGARHYVVAHSHGGNIALRAVSRSPTLKREVRGIVAIATPFLQFTQNSFFLALLEPALQATVETMLLSVQAAMIPWEFAMQFSPLLLFILIAFAIVSSYVHFRTDAFLFAPGIVGTLYSFLFQVFAMLGGILFGLWFFGLGWDLAKTLNTGTLQRESRLVFRRYTYWQPELGLAGTRVFALSSLLDEAYGVLMGSWWMHRATGWGVRFSIGSAIAMSILLSAASFYGEARLLMLASNSYGWSTLVRFVGPIVVFLTFCFFIILTHALAKLSLAISGRSNLFLDLADPKDNLVCQVRAQRSLPLPIRTTNKRYGIWQLLWHAKGALFHSRIYFHRPAIRDIAEWMTSEPKVARSSVSSESSIATRPT